MENINVTILQPEHMTNAKKATFGYRVVTITEPSMNKGGRNGVAPNPLLGRVQKLTTYYNLLLGASYENRVNALRELEGKEANFVAQAQRGTHYFDAFFNESDKELGVYYLKMGYRRSGSKSSYTYLVDGRVATHEEVATIEYYLQKKSENKSQGLDNPYKHFTTKAENVLYVGQKKALFYRSERLVEYLDLIDFEPKDFEVVCSQEEYEAMMERQGL